MKFSPTHLPLFVIPALGLITNPAFGATLLTNTEMDQFGAGGESKVL